MAEKEMLVSIQKALDENKDYAGLLAAKNMPVVCIKRGTGEKKNISFKILFENNNKFWLQSKVWDFFLLEENLAAVREASEAAKFRGFSGVIPAADDKKPAPQEKLPVREQAGPRAEVNPSIDGAPPPEKQAGPAPVVNILPDSGYGDGYPAITAMTQSEQINFINESKKRLDNLFLQKPKDEKAITSALVDTTRDVALINHAALLEAMNLADDKAKKQTQSLVDSTCALVESSNALVSPGVFDDDLMTSLIEKSNGTIIQHMVRVYLNGTAFLSYYNKLVTESSITTKIRINFKQKYQDFYCDLMPYIGREAMTLERIFMGGMRIITTEEFRNWAIGFLLHDVGKAAAVEYHESEAAYNRDIVIQHVKVGYSSIMEKTNYPREAGLVTGYHHEYYGDTSGYGYFRAFLAQYRKANPGAVPQHHCITYDLAPIVEFKALAYFPIKILEIIDVYDSVTDQGRKYRKALTSEEALAMMREEFIEKHRKIDIILFDIFADFVREKAGKK